jgi:hypothetical protein
MTQDVGYIQESRVDPKTGVVMCKVTRDQQGELPIGELPLMQSVGMTAMPYGKSGEGDATTTAEAVVLDNLGGFEAVVVGGRDHRTAKMVGAMKPGDTVLHTTGPNEVAQVQLKEKKRQAMLVTRRKNGEMMIINLDGAEDVVHIAAFKFVIQITPDGGIEMSSANGKNGITISDDVVWVRGNVVLGGATPIPGMALMIGPAIGSPGGPAGAPLIPAMGVAVGA